VRRRYGSSEAGPNDDVRQRAMRPASVFSSATEEVAVVVIGCAPGCAVTGDRRPGDLPEAGRQSIDTRATVREAEIVRDLPCSRGLIRPTPSGRCLGFEELAVARASPAPASPTEGSTMLAEIIGPDILILIAVVALLFGSTQIPKLARSLGSAQREFKHGLDHPDESAVVGAPVATPVVVTAVESTEGR
jgi:sec-independent protein translocase protein TatA